MADPGSRNKRETAAAAVDRRSAAVGRVRDEAKKTAATATERVKPWYQNPFGSKDDTAAQAATVQRAPVKEEVEEVSGLWGRWFGSGRQQTPALGPLCDDIWICPSSTGTAVDVLIGCPVFREDGGRMEGRSCVKRPAAAAAADTKALGAAHAWHIRSDWLLSVDTFVWDGLFTMMRGGTASLTDLTVGPVNAHPKAATGAADIPTELAEAVVSTVRPLRSLTLDTVLMPYAAVQPFTTTLLTGGGLRELRNLSVKGTVALWLAMGAALMKTGTDGDGPRRLTTFLPMVEHLEFAFLSSSVSAAAAAAGKGNGNRKPNSAPFWRAVNGGGLPALKNLTLRIPAYDDTAAADVYLSQKVRGDQRSIDELYLALDAVPRVAAAIEHFQAAAGCFPAYRTFLHVDLVAAPGDFDDVGAEAMAVVAGALFRRAAASVPPPNAQVTIRPARSSAAVYRVAGVRAFLERCARRWTQPTGWLGIDVSALVPLLEEGGATAAVAIGKPIPGRANVLIRLEG
jgi:hypothetical protein